MGHPKKKNGGTNEGEGGKKQKRNGELKGSAKKNKKRKEVKWNVIGT